MFQFMRNQMPAQRRRRVLTERLRRFTEASVTLHPTPAPLSPPAIPSTPTSGDAVYGFTYTGWGLR